MRGVVLTFVVAVLGAPAAAQTAAPPKGPAPVTPAGASASVEAATPATYSYQPAGRRNPFTNLIGLGAETRGPGRRGDGSEGLSVSELSIRGVLEGRSGVIAMVEGPDKKTIVVHPGDKLADGRIKTITPQGLVIVQDVNDPLSLVKQREVRKLLRSLEDAKQ